jgi:hypothetical protein
VTFTQVIRIVKRRLVSTLCPDEAFSDGNARGTQTAENERTELNVAAGLDAHCQQRYVVAL